MVDSLASGASARKGVRVRLPPRAPTRRKRHIACDEFFYFIAKLIARSFCCSSLPNRTRCAGLRFGFGYKTEGWHRSCCNVLKTVAWAGGCLSFWVSLPLVAPPFGISMLGRSEFALRQGFRHRRKRLYGASAPPARRPVLTSPGQKDVIRPILFWNNAGQNERHPPLADAFRFFVPQPTLIPMRRATSSIPCPSGTRRLFPATSFSRFSPTWLFFMATVTP